MKPEFGNSSKTVIRLNRKFFFPKKR